jgi:GH15 family glucan-1,4-alpha-glucosidase
MSYLPIEDYGIIGNMHTAALVGRNGSIDWLCIPHFDSPSVFAGILDDRKGGRFKIAPTNEDATCKQMYWPDTNVLVTRFLSCEGVAEITDFMPVGAGLSKLEHHQLIRRVKVVRGTMQFCLRCQPAFDYARQEHTVKIGENGASFHSRDLHLGLATSVPLKQEEASIVAEFSLKDQETAEFVLRQIEPGQDCGSPCSEGKAEELFQHTVDYWRNWISKSTYHGRWQEIVYRSALVLKLLTFEPTGAIVAAPTCSLPEYLGGERNWDYRYTWLRDAAFTVYGLIRIGLTEEAARFIDWLDTRCHDSNPDGSLQIMYGLDGRRDLEEEILDHLEGYRGSRPVRIGNAAYNQFQLDIYGEMMDSVYLYNKYRTPISYDLWLELRQILNWVVDNWDRKDRGIWEFRGQDEHFVYSKLMCWVALDRGIRLADKRSFPADHERWRKARDKIYQQIIDKGWNSEREAFVEYYGGDTLDAATLIMPMVFFMSPTDPLMLKTIEAIQRPPKEGGLVSDSLVYRYDPEMRADGIQGEEGTFNICTFWLVEALTRAGQVDPRRLQQARLIFERMLGYANHVGLFSEETGPRGEALGNFPQALTHLSLISAAFNLNRTLGKRSSD